VKVFVCTACSLGREGFAATVRAAFAGIAAEVLEIECMSGCTRDQTIAFRAPGKTAYLFGDITEEHLADLLTFARLYEASPDGTFADARVLGALRTKAIARIPG
jgi:predicted metal-binding protein